jgi:hypothetical protein
MASLLYRVGTGGDTTGDTSVKKIDEVNELGKNPTERAENLSLPREDRRLLTEASRFQQTLDNAQQVLLRSPWYAFVMKVVSTRTPRTRTILSSILTVYSPTSYRLGLATNQSINSGRKQGTRIGH